MARTTTANTSRRPAGAMIALGLTLAASAAIPLRAEMLGEAEIRDKAASMASSDIVRNALGAGRTLASVERIAFPKGELWVANFSPSGHAILTPSTRLGVLFSLSECDFVYPGVDSPEYAMCDNAAGAAVAREAEAGEPPSPGRVTTQAIRSYAYIPPITVTRWNQAGTVNWFSPKDAPCGCTAVAYAQMMRALEWPVWIGETRTASLGYEGANFERYCMYPYTKIDYSKMTEMAYWTVDSADQSMEVAKSTMLVDIESLMRFNMNSQGSGAWMQDAATNPWYEAPVALRKGSDTSSVFYDDYLEAFHQAAVDGIPLCAEVETEEGYHSVMLSGWSGGSGSEMVYFNFGWGHSEWYPRNRWYNLNIVYTSGAVGGINVAYLSRPKKTVQVAPIAKVCGLRPVLEWVIAACYTNKVSGFTVKAVCAATGDVRTFDVADPKARAWTAAADFEDGAEYSLSVTPVFKDSSWTAIPSAAQTTRIVAGTDMSPRTLEFSSLDGVAREEMKFNDGVLRDVTLQGDSVVCVKAPPSTVKLTIHPNRPDSFPESAFAIHPKGAGLFDIAVDGAAMRDKYEQTRALFTVCAEDAYGTVTAKDLVLRFCSQTTSPESYTAPAATTAVAVSDSGDKAIPNAWVLARKPEIPVSGYRTWLADDSDGDGHTNAEEYFIGTDPLDGADRLRINGITVEGGIAHVDYSPKENGSVATFELQGKATLDGTWKKHGTTDFGHRFFRVVVTPK